jgi:hypothetical protein
MAQMAASQETHHSWKTNSVDFRQETLFEVAIESLEENDLSDKVRL